MDNIVFDFDNAEEMRNMEVFARFERVSSQGNLDIASMVFRQMLPYNDPTSPGLAALKMEARAKQLLQHAIEFSDANSLGLSAEKYSITGANRYSVAYRKIIGAVKAGGDLKSLLTCSGCEKFHKQANKAREAAELKNKVEHEVATSLIKKGMDPTTPEFKEKMKEELRLVLGTDEQRSVAADKAALNATKDWISEAVAKFEAEARRWFVDGGGDPKDIQDSIDYHTQVLKIDADRAIAALSRLAANS